MAEQIPSVLEEILEYYPKDIELRPIFRSMLRPLCPHDEKALHEFFGEVPYQERMFIKHRVFDPAVIHDWCANIDYYHNLPMVAWADDRIIGVATLHQALGGWKRHIGRLSVLVHPKYRGRGLARLMVLEMIIVARAVGLQKVEAEFVAEQTQAIKVFSLAGFTELARLSDYVKDMQGVSHDYVLMGMHLSTDEEFASAG